MHRIVPLTLLGLLGLAGFAYAAECTDIDAPIGDVDIEVSAYLTHDGMKQVITNHQTGKSDASTALWADVFSH